MQNNHVPHRIELLAPAKDLATGMAAINCGADAVYLGAARFGAREAAGNDLAAIEQLARYAHKYWARVYVTVNTLLYDDELSQAVRLIHQLYQAGADALIIQDVGLLECDLPPLPLFASTQMHNHTPERVAFLEQVGFQRVILARELSLEQINAIRARTSIELETFEILKIAAVADLLPERARAQAEKYHIPRACSVAELLADPSIEIIINLTIPNAHAEVAFQALEAGKSVYNEKPLAITRADGQKMLALARQKGLLVGGAPDTFLGGGLQTCRKLIDDGQIGQPVAATAFMLCHGHESWHPAPEFYYKVGGGPMFDMGPYYLTALVSLIGPVRRVTGSARITFPTRTITSQPLNGTVITVDVPTHVTGVLDFENGAIATIVTSFDVWAHNVPRIEIYGTAGSLSVPDPNGFGGPVMVRRPGMDAWADVPLTHGYDQNSRSIGVADMAYALRTGRPARASGEQCYHVLDIMHTIHDASQDGKHVLLESTCAQPRPLPLGLAAGKLD